VDPEQASIEAAASRDSAASEEVFSPEKRFEEVCIGPRTLTTRQAHAKRGLT
jgi:hypothetical protein